MAGGTRRKKKKTTTHAVKEAMPCRIARAQGCVPYICKGRMAFISRIKTTLLGLWLQAQEDNRGKLERIKPFPLGAPSMGLLAHFTHCEYSSVITQYTPLVRLRLHRQVHPRCASVSGTEHTDDNANNNSLQESCFPPCQFLFPSLLSTSLSLFFIV